MKKIILLTILIFMFIFLSSCASVTIRSQDGGLSYYPRDSKAIPTHNIITHESFYFIFSPDIYSFSTPFQELDRLLKSQYRENTEFVRDIEITYKFTLLDFLITGIVPIISRSTIVINGIAYTK